MAIVAQWKERINVLLGRWNYAHNKYNITILLYDVWSTHIAKGLAAGIIQTSCCVGTEIYQKKKKNNITVDLFYFYRIYMNNIFNRVKNCCEKKINQKPRVYHFLFNTSLQKCMLVTYIILICIRNYYSPSRNSFKPYIYIVK